jgi:hypothetical protein
VIVVEKPQEIEKLSVSRQKIRRELYGIVMESFNGRETQEIVRQTSDTTLRTKVRKDEDDQ